MFTEHGDSGTFYRTFGVKNLLVFESAIEFQLSSSTTDSSKFCLQSFYCKNFTVYTLSLLNCNKTTVKLVLSSMKIIISKEAMVRK